MSSESERDVPSYQRNEYVTFLNLKESQRRTMKTVAWSFGGKIWALWGSLQVLRQIFAHPGSWLFMSPVPQIVTKEVR